MKYITHQRLFKQTWIRALLLAMHLYLFIYFYCFSITPDTFMCLRTGQYLLFNFCSSSRLSVLNYENPLLLIT